MNTEQHSIKFMAGDVIRTGEKTSVLWASPKGLVAHVIVEDGLTTTRPRLEDFTELIAASESKVVGHVQTQMLLKEKGQYALEHRDLVKAYFAAQERGK